LLCGLPLWTCGLSRLYSVPALLKCIAHRMASAIIGTDLIKEALVCDFPFRDRIAARLELLHNFCLGFRQQVRIFLKDLNDFVGRKILVLLLCMRERYQGEE
jgi:hypothetical protein